MSITALPVLARILTDHRVETSKTGTLALTQATRVRLEQLLTELVSCNGGRFTRHFQIPAGQRLIGTRRACK